MPRILVLDDDLTRLMAFNQRLIGSVVDCVTTSKEAIDKLKENEYQIVYLDHDLGGMTHCTSGENTGYEVAKFISTMETRPRNIVIHSFNTVGAKNMMSLLPESIYSPGCWCLN